MRKLTGKEAVVYFNKKTAEAITDGDPVMINSSGELVKADETATADTFKGMAVGNYEADTDAKVMTDVMEDAQDLYSIKVGAGEFTADKVGKKYKLTTDGYIDLATEGGDLLEVVRKEDDNNVIVRKA